MSDQRNLHVVFGTGPLGLAVMRSLLADDFRVRMVNRSGKGDVPSAVELVEADALDLNDVRNACDGASIVYQCASPPPRLIEIFPRFQRNILEIAGIVGATLVIADNLYCYGDVGGPITEDLPMSAATDKGRRRAAMGREALEACAAGKVRVAIGRASDFFGPYVLHSAMGERAIVPAFRGKTSKLIGDIDQPHTFTFIDDFARALITLGRHQEALGHAWHVPNPPTLTQREFMTRIFDAIGARPDMKGTGKTMMTIGGIFIDAAQEMVEVMYQFEKPWVVDSSRFESTFNQNATPLDEAIRRTVEWYRGYAAS